METRDPVKQLAIRNSSISKEELYLPSLGPVESPGLKEQVPGVGSAGAECVSEGRRKLLKASRQHGYICSLLSNVDVRL